MMIADKKGGLFWWKDLKGEVDCMHLENERWYSGGKLIKMKTRISSSITCLSSIPHSNSKVLVF